MKDLFLCRVTQAIATVLVSVALLAGAAIAGGVEVKSDDDWHFTVIPYLWLPSFDGSMNISGPAGVSSGTLDLNADNYLDSLKFAAMLTVEVEKGRFSLLSDVMYADFGTNGSTAKFPSFPGGGLEINADVKFKALVFEIAPAYSLYLSESTRFDVLAGVRYIGMDTDVTLNPSIGLPIALPSRNVSVSKDLVDPIVGFKGRFELGKGWFLPYYADVGGFGINKEWTWQVFGGVGYHFSKLYSMVLAYRHLEYDFADSEPIKDVYMSGVELGFVFRF
jgi:hypothetical protein